jgi:hypothetical protein
MFMQHWETYGKARLLLADEVGLGKTLSLGASAMVSALLDDGPVLILCPSTLTLQWQVELKDKLGIPSAVWLSNRKVWLDHNGNVIKTGGAEDIVRCPYRIGIVSTGLIFRGGAESDALKQRSYGTLILDEAHRARRSRGRRAEQSAPLHGRGSKACETRHPRHGDADPDRRRGTMGSARYPQSRGGPRARPLGWAVAAVPARAAAGHRQEGGQG